MIEVNRANAYFKGHVKGVVWAEYSPDQKVGAIEQAKRELSRNFKRAMRDDEPEYQPGESLRDEFAVYEQALHTLEQVGIVRGTTGNVQDLTGRANDAGATAPKTQMEVSPAALRWLGIRVVTRIAN